MAFYLFWPDSSLLEREGFSSVSHVPCIFNGEWSYEKLASRYLRERALLEWTPVQDGVYGFGGGKYPGHGSLRVYGYALCNFLEWCQLRGLALADLDYTRHLVQGYQAEMLAGLWSANKTSLKPKTVNLRVKEALHYVRWAVDRGVRPAFRVTTVIRKIKANSAANSHGHQALRIESRAGAVRPNPMQLSLPTDEAVRQWFQSVEIEKGPTKALMCELILKTGIRREEAVQWRLDTLPEDRKAWKARGDYIDVAIRYGTKGTKYRDASGEDVGPERVIQLPLELALRLAYYREFVRPRQRAEFVREAPDATERRRRMRTQPKRLFLSDSTGEPISAQSLYEAWTDVTRLPFKGWAPHPGRHYWACKTLLTALAGSLRVHGTARQVPLDWISGAGQSIISLVIQPQLGHVSAETTNTYLGWAHRALTITSLQDDYAAALEAVLQKEELDG